MMLYINQLKTPFGESMNSLTFFVNYESLAHDQWLKLGAYKACLVDVEPSKFFLKWWNMRRSDVVV